MMSKEPLADAGAERLLLGEAEDSRQPPRLDASGYSSLVKEHFFRPRNVGQLSGPGVASARAGSRAAGAEILFSFRAVQGKVAETRFQAFGCPHLLAAASLATEQLKGREVSELRSWQVREIGDTIQIPVEKRGRLLILED